MRHIIPISGKDSLATALFQVAHERDLPYEFLYNDTHAELPETYAWLNKVEKETGFEIKRIGEDLTKIIEGFDVLPSHKMRYCTRMAKIQPMETWIGKEDDATVYYGLRADEDRGGYVARSHNITPAYPLRDFNIDLQGVWTILEVRDLLPPTFFWTPLYDRVVEMVGPEDSWPVSLAPWQRAVLFSGRTRANCYYCFYQRQYEYAWLCQTHPHLYREACRLEEEHGGDDYTWREGYSLSEIEGRVDELINSRARQVSKTLNALAQTNMFGDSADTLLASTSCGLLCGK